ncbi:MAG: hypothetical protein NTV80_03320 [Verrucomicrobia bacterium]|nr:hypothetical protein [Verrucomicrobiota bacterium]
MKRAFSIFMFFAMGVTLVQASDSTVIPQAYDAGRYSASWEVNPFHAKIGPPPPQAPDWSKHWTLAAMLNNHGAVRVTIKSTLTGQMKYVSSQSAPGDEFKLIKAQFHRNRENASVVIFHMNQEAELKYQP